MEISTVGAALEIVSKAWKGLEAVRERAQASKDTVLKDGVSGLYDQFIALKSIIIRLTDENEALRRAQAEKPQWPEIRQTGDANHYFVGDVGPYCQPCYDLQGKLMTLSPRQRYAGGMGRKCEVCKAVFIEESLPMPRLRVERV